MIIFAMSISNCVLKDIVNELKSYKILESCYIRSTNFETVYGTSRVM